MWNWSKHPRISPLALGWGRKRKSRSAAFLSAQVNGQWKYGNKKSQVEVGKEGRKVFKEGCRGRNVDENIVRHSRRKAKRRP